MSLLSHPHELRAREVESDWEKEEGDALKTSGEKVILWREEN
jgi:hypothetical protein